MHQIGALSEGLALIFDLDGVIVDSMPVHAQAWSQYMQRLGLSCDDLNRRMHGRRNDEIVLDFIDPKLSPEEVFAHGAAKEQLFRDMIGPELRDRLVPGVVDFIREHCYAPLGVASNAEPANIAFVIDGAGIRECFRTIVDGMQVERPKPHPDVYLEAARQLGIPPRNAIIFEDSPTGIAAARAAGSRVVGVETHAPLENVDVRVPNFRDPDLKEWLCAQRPL